MCHFVCGWSQHPNTTVFWRIVINQQGENLCLKLHQALNINYWTAPNNPLWEDLQVLRFVHNERMQTRNTDKIHHQNPKFLLHWVKKNHKQNTSMSEINLYEYSTEFTKGSCVKEVVFALAFAQRQRAPPPRPEPTMGRQASCKSLLYSASDKTTLLSHEVSDLF